MKHLALLLAMFSFAVVVEAAEPAQRTLIVWDFEQGITNSQGGQYNAFQREPSLLRTYLDSSASHTLGGHSLRITAHRDGDGFCGVWLDLHGFSDASREYLDASRYRFLSFWAKGAKGGEDFDIELTDASSAQDEDQQTRRPLHAYLPRGLSTGWQEVVIPLSDYPKIDPGRLIRMSIDLTRRGEFRFYIDDIAFKRLRVGGIPSDDPRPVAASRPAPEKAHCAMWVWNTKPLFDTSRRDEADRFFAFCARHNIQEIYLAAEFDRSGKDEAPVFSLRNPDGYRQFISHAHQQRLRTEALAGTPEWGVRENHAQALAALEAIIAHNRSNSASSRFDGIHYDVEPYALIGYADPHYRPQILTEFLEMVDQCSVRCRKEGLPFACDVPSWFFPRGGLERNRMTVTFKGTENTVGGHLLDLLDGVTIMDYTNQADGASGIIARGLPAIEYASTQSKKVVVGLETFSEHASVVSFACGLPAEEFWPRLAAAGIRNQIFFEDFRMSLFSDDVNVHPGLSMPAAATAEKRAACEAALARLARKLGAASDPKRFPAVPMLDLARAAMSASPEWLSFEPFEFQDPETERSITAFRASRRMQPGITFHGLGRKTFEEEYSSAVEWLSKQPGFDGMAVHFYESFRELMEGEEQDSGVRIQESGTGTRESGSQGN